MIKLESKVSIVIPCFNVEEYVKECLDSLCQQTYKNIEIIFVDDGSTDHTIDILEDYRMRDTRVSLIKQRNQFAGVARNNGLKIATGEYVCFLDADDYFSPTIIEEMLYSAKSNEADIVLCNAYFLNNMTKEILEPTHILNMNYLKAFKDVFSYSDIPERILTVGFSVPWNKLFRKKFIMEKELWFQNTKRCNDEYFVSMAMALAKKISYVDKRLVTYRINNIKSLQGYGEQKVSHDFFEAYKAIRNGLIKNKIYKELKINFINKVLSGCVSLLEKQQISENFIELYDFIKSTVFIEMDMALIPIESLYSNRETYENIRKYSAQEYLFYRFKSYQKSGGEKYMIPYAELESKNQVAIYGAGDVGKSYFRQMLGSNYYKIVAWFDINYQILQKSGLPVINPEEIGKYDFDKILIAINDETIFKQIYKYLIDKEIPKEKIVWKCN